MAERLTAAQVAERLGVTRDTVLNWYRLGWIPAVQSWRRPFLFDPVAVEQSLQRRADERRGVLTHA
jgi:excisionase family DNA binding protein